MSSKTTSNKTSSSKSGSRSRWSFLPTAAMNMFGQQQPKTNAVVVRRGATTTSDDNNNNNSEQQSKKQQQQQQCQPKQQQEHQQEQNPESKQHQEQQRRRRWKLVIDDSSSSSESIQRRRRRQATSVVESKIPKRQNNNKNLSDHSQQQQQQQLVINMDDDDADHHRNDVVVVVTAKNETFAVSDKNHNNDYGPSRLHDKNQEEMDHCSILSVSSTTTSLSTEDDGAAMKTSGENSSCLPPTMDALKFQCWKCGVPFRQSSLPEESGGASSNSNNNNSSTSGAFCFYVMHVHPILEVPICFVCSRHVREAQEQQQENQALKQEKRGTNNDDDNDDDYCCCVGCGDDDDDHHGDVFFYCDTCPATFCQLCVAKALGGGVSGLQQSQQLQQVNEKWSCPKCQPPPPLVSLQQFVQDLSNEGDGENSSSEQQQSHRPRPRRTPEQVLEEYMKVEDERELVDWYLSPEQRDYQRQRIQKELLSITTNTNTKKTIKTKAKPIMDIKDNRMEEEVEEEMHLWEQQLLDHDARLTDMSTTLQDELSAMKVAIPYRAIPELDKIIQSNRRQEMVKSANNDNNDGTAMKQDQGNNDDSNAQVEDPPWKRQADLACDQRQKQDQAQSYKVMIPTYHDEAWDDVEDLRTSDLDDSGCMEEDNDDNKERSQWRSQCKVQKHDIELVTRWEDEQLLQRNIVIKKHVSDDQDAQHIQQEEQLESTLGSRGIARIRRDDYQRFKMQTSGGGGSSTTQTRHPRQNTSLQQQEPTQTTTKCEKVTDATVGSSNVNNKNNSSSINNNDNPDIVSTPRKWRVVPIQKKLASAKRKLIPSKQEPDEHEKPAVSKKRRIELTSLLPDTDEHDSLVPCSDIPASVTDSVSTDHDKRPNSPVPPNGIKTPLPHSNNDTKVARGLRSGTTADSPLVVEDTPPTSPTRNDCNDSTSYCSSVSDVKDIFAGTSLILNANNIDDDAAAGKSRSSVSIAEPLATRLKPHQIEGVQFMFRNTFADLLPMKNKKGQAEDSKMSDNDTSGVSGCILAHNMGLGKTLCCISLLHCILCHPELTMKGTKGVKRPSIRTVLVVVPMNTLANWEAEFDKWTGQLDPTVRVMNFGALDVGARRRNIFKWTAKGGVLLISEKMFLRIARDFPENMLLPGPDVIVLDEAHVMVKNAVTEIFKTLSKVATKRRIALTGSPIQNNLLEYYRMVSWVRPGLLGTESEFDERYIAPITAGLPKDATDEAHQLSDEKSQELHELLSPFVHRKDAEIFKDELPFMQQVVLHIRPSKLQTQFYRAAKRFPNKNFFFLFQALKPVHNHPGCLLMTPATGKGQQVSGHVDENEAISVNQAESDKPTTIPAITNLMPCSATVAAEKELEVDKWWMKIAKRIGFENMKDINHGYKMVLFLHILVLAQRNGEKVMLFTKCCKTLDFIEEVLNLEDWGNNVESLRSELGQEIYGNWRKNIDYLRIDGQVGSCERGELVAKFNDVTESADCAKLFLISKAGGIGVNLVGASRVVLFDCDFNPTVNIQALYRCYRYGQTRPVFAYHFLTEGSMEEKIYSRCVTKTGMALRVVDKKTISRSFSAKELNDLSDQDLWVQCDRCKKWRMLPPDEKGEDLPDKWYCEMNLMDTINNNCDVSEKDKDWYYKQGRPVIGTDSTAGKDRSEDVLPDSEKAKFVGRDPILQQILHISADDGKCSPSKGKSAGHKRKSANSTGKSLLISKYYFHYKLLESTSETEEEDGDADGLLGPTEHTDTTPSRKVASKTAGTPINPKARSSVSGSPVPTKPSPAPRRRKLQLTSKTTRGKADNSKIEQMSSASPISKTVERKSSNDVELEPTSKASHILPSETTHGNDRIEQIGSKQVTNVENPTSEQRQVSNASNDVIDLVDSEDEGEDGEFYV